MNATSKCEHNDAIVAGLRDTERVLTGMEPDEENKELILEGIAASPGVAHGPAFVLHQHALEVPAYRVSESGIREEISRFEQALVLTRQQILAIRGQIAEKLGEDEAQIFDAHLLVLEDKALIDETIRELEDTRFNVDYIFNEVASRYIAAFLKIDDEYIKERVADIRDVSRRLLNNLMGRANNAFGAFAEAKVVVAEDLTPSDTAVFDRNKLLAIVTDAGGRTSHASIMARSLEVPAVVGLHDGVGRIDPGTSLLVDGYEGVVIVNPSEKTLFRYGKIRLRRETIREIFSETASERAITIDGREVRVSANVEGSEPPDLFKTKGAEGVGLFRTEMLFLRQNMFPPEDEQYEHYRRIVEALPQEPVTIRTWDLGGDKSMGPFASLKENNPFMGYRAIRFCLEHPELFKEQLRAILRASVHGQVKILVPMISGVKEMVATRKLIEDAKLELRQRRQAFASDITVGCMIEIPSAVCVMDLLADHCDFFSIGTNDLIQYLMAVDRVNDRIAHLYEPCHPAVPRTLKKIFDFAHQVQKPVSVCGELAGEAVYVPLLIGLGACELSASPAAIPEIKFLVRHLRYDECQDLAREVLTQSESDTTAQMLREFRQERVERVLTQRLTEAGVATNGSSSPFPPTHTPPSQEKS